MAANDKLIAKILSKRNVTSEDCEKILVDFGYELHKSGGSHRTYHKKEAIPITIIQPKNTKYIKTPYIDRIIKELGLEEYHEKG